MKRTILILAALVLVLGGTPAELRAGVIVAPPGNAVIEGDSNNGYPFNLGPQRYQQIYNASLFSGQSGVVDKIMFRVEGGNGSFAGQTFNLDVRLSHTTATAATLSTTYANNIGADETVVLSGNVTLSGTGGPGPNPFDVVLDLNNVFAYNGTGNLLLDIRLFSGSAGVQFDSVYSAPGANSMQRVWGPVAGSTGSIAGDMGLVTAFDLQVTQAVPEPASLALLGSAAAAGAGYLGLRRSRRPLSA